MAQLDKIPMTPAGHAALEAELKQRQQEERPRIVEAIAEARSHGDLSENAEYHSAKEAQSHNEGRIVELEDSRFRDDPRTQQAVIMSLMIIGEAAARMLELYPQITDNNPDVPWLAMRGMRNRIAHGYFAMDMGIVWTTARTTLPEIIRKLDGLV